MLVEKDGYSPPTKQLIADIQSQDSAVMASSSASAAGSSSTSAAANKKAKKKKKKQQQQASAKAPATTEVPSEPETKSQQPSASQADEDLSDPVAVALLGMGFTEDQIKSAARALGGFERATADDMVMWILGGGEIVDNSSGGNDGGGNNAATAAEEQQATSNENPNNNEAEKPEAAAVMTKAQKKAAARAKREAEEAAQKVAAAQRAAAKREEQRRIRREWNEREQARQAQEKSNKIAEAMERRQRVERDKLLPKPSVLPGGLPVAVGGAAAAVAGGGIPPAISVPPAGGGKGNRAGAPHGPPMTIIAGGPKAAGAKSKNAGSNMGIPQAPTVRAPKILTRPSNAPPGTLPGGNVGPSGTAPSAASAGNQPLFAGTGTSSGASKPISSANSPPRGGVHAKPFNPASHRQPTAILQKNPSAVASHLGANSRRVQHSVPPEYHHHPGHHASKAYHGTQPPNVAGLSTQQFQNQSKVAGGTGPPGFVPGSTLMQPPEPPAMESASTYVESNPMGTIRATAREFVPTSFKPAPAPAVPEMNVVPSMSAQQGSVPVVTAPAVAASPPPPTRSTSNEHSSNLLVEPMSSLLSSFGADSSTPPATMVPMVGNKEDSTVPSAASSITGLSGLPTAGEDNATSRVGSVMTFESTSSGAGIQTSSILESISYGLGDQNTGSALGSGGIWGGGNNVNQTASLGLAGLNFSSFMGNGGATRNENEGNDLAGGSTTWGTSTGGSGSIW